MMRCLIKLTLFPLMIILLATASRTDADEVDEVKALHKQIEQSLTAGKYKQAEPIAEDALKRAKRLTQRDPDLISDSLFYLALIYHQTSRHGDALQSMKRSLDEFKKLNGVMDNNHFVNGVGLRLNKIGRYYQYLGRYADAEATLSESAEMLQNMFKDGLTTLQEALDHLGYIYYVTGRYSLAEQLYQRVLAARENGQNRDLHEIANSLTNLGNLYDTESREEEAERYLARASQIFKQLYGEDHERYGTSLRQLGYVYAHQKRYEEAEKMGRRALEILQKVHGEQHFELIGCLTLIGQVLDDQGRYEESAEVHQRSLAVREALLGKDHPMITAALTEVALSYYRLERYDDAERLMNRAIEITDRSGQGPQFRYTRYLPRAVIRWHAGRKDDALIDLHHALDLAELVRQNSSGGDVERAQSFAEFGQAFERMVAWQAELGGIAEAYETMERSRARSLLDEMNRAKVDVDAGRTPEERRSLKERESMLQNRIAQLESQVGSNESAGLPEAESGKLREKLAQARRDLYEHYRDERSTNPIYRDLLTRGTKHATFDDVRQKLLGSHGLALMYLFGRKGGFVLILSAEQAKLVPLEVNENVATILQTTAGPLTQERLQQILIGKDNQGIVPQIARRTAADKAISEEALITRLEALLPILIPEPECTSISTSKYKRLVIIPDGPLALLPFETLVVHGGQNPEYLLDNGPAILYGPSASILCNLADRGITPPGTRAPVLTIADPLYQQEVPAQSPSRSVSDDKSSRSRYARVGGQLKRLPFTGTESAAIIEAFKKVGTELGQLKREMATEANVRFNASGRKIVHFACHGLTDELYGNFFGALALTPGYQGGPNPSADDGFLTLAEIYELKLQGCDLAILSACETNYGPQQQGEGTWALSRGFLVAGVRSVVASNWLVDDEAAANLIGVFCADVAPDQKQGQTVDYATQLQAAKRYIRSQPRWKSPYYWSTFVLVGPN